MIRKYSHTTAGLLLAWLTVSCQPHDPFCFSHPHGLKARIDVDWSDFVKDTPDGMTLHVFPGDDTQRPTTETTHTITRASFTLMPDDYLVMVHNQSASEFGSVVFRNMDDRNAAEVRTVECTSDWYRPKDGEKLGQTPEWLAFDTRSIAVTGEMMEAAGNEEISVGTMTPQNVVYTLHVRLKADGVENFRAGRAAITGLSDGYRPGVNEYHTDRVTHLLEAWNVEPTSSGRATDGSTSTTGYITSEITCFGLPPGRGGMAEENVLHLKLLLVDNKTIVAGTFNVGNRIRQFMTDGDPLHLYIELTLPEKLPDVEAATDDSQSGFDAEVDDWGNEIDQDVGL